MLYILLWMLCLLLLFFSFFSTKPIDWLRRKSPKLHILCRVGRKTLTQSVSQSIQQYVVRLDWTQWAFIMHHPLI